MNTSKNALTITVNGVKIHFKTDDSTMRLTDIHRASKLPDSRKPSKWMHLPSTKDFHEAMRDCGKIGPRSPLVVTRNSAGTWANTIVALEYARYLDPKLAIEINDLYLRMKMGDKSVVEQTVENMPPEAIDQLGSEIRHSALLTMFRGMVSSIPTVLRTKELIPTVYHAIREGAFGAQAAADLTVRKDKELKTKLEKQGYENIHPNADYMHLTSSQLAVEYRAVDTALRCYSSKEIQFLIRDARSRVAKEELMAFFLICGSHAAMTDSTKERLRGSDGIIGMMISEKARILGETEEHIAESLTEAMRKIRKSK